MSIYPHPLLAPSFAPHVLTNRLGQPLQVWLANHLFQGRHYLCVAVPEQGPGFMGKNAETFAFQLREHFALDPRQFDLIEVRLQEEEPVLLRWRFEWVGYSPLSPRSELVSAGQAQLLLGVLQAEQPVEVAGA